MSQHETYAVLTGDIIKSRLLSNNNLEAVRTSLLKATDIINGWQQGLVESKPEFFRGDAWQLLLTNPAMALRATVFLRATVLAQGIADTRTSIGLGKVENISPNRVSLSTGEAFILSGTGLDSMTQYSNMTIETSKTIQPLAGWLPTVGHLCDALISQWTKRQAQIICIAINPKEPIHDEIALMLNPTVSKQTITKALNSSNWYVIRETIHCFEKIPWKTPL